MKREFSKYIFKIFKKNSLHVHISKKKKRLFIQRGMTACMNQVVIVQSRSRLQHSKIFWYYGVGWRPSPQYPKYSCPRDSNKENMT